MPLLAIEEDDHCSVHYPVIELTARDLSTEVSASQSVGVCRLTNQTQTLAFYDESPLALLIEVLICALNVPS